MPDPLFGTTSPFALQVEAHQARDRYLASLLGTGLRALWTALFGTRETAHDAAEVFHDCYVKDTDLIHIPDARGLAARHSNDRRRHDAAA
ncbi:hypothetical protein [uncultured Rhodospira sp.]|uniref:hypothetical protein n=1 Tax=uncultured Rhodospira sp. TaxID=1936189 RepID=UPI0026038392|nr:hypothetical protein [uncultured Rhodospira sp.]